MSGFDNIHSHDSADGKSNVLATDIADLLFKQYVIITGGKTNIRCPIITFPDNGLFDTLSDYDYRRLLSYITSVPPLHESDNGFVLIVDRTGDRWSSVKHILFKFTEFFPGLIHAVYVLRPIGIWQKMVSDFSNTFLKESFKFNVIMLDCVDELHQCIDKSELTSHLKGSLPYDHESWIQQRIALEEFESQMRILSQELHCFTHAIQLCTDNLPRTVDETVFQINHHSIKFNDLKDSFLALTRKGENVLRNVKQGNPSNQLPPSVINNSSSVERSLVQLDETEKTFDKFWEDNSSKLKDCLKLRTFEADFEESRSRLTEYLNMASEMNEICESVEHADELIEKLNAFHSLCQIEIEKSETLMQRGSNMLNGPRSIDVSDVGWRCDELKMLNQSLAERLLARVNVLKKTREFQIRIKKANEWCSGAIELLESDSMENCSTSTEKIETALADLEQFVASADAFNVLGSDDLYSLVECDVIPDARNIMTQVLQRIEDVTVMCDKRITQLRRLLVKCNQRPVQTIVLEAPDDHDEDNKMEENNNNESSHILTNGNSQDTVSIDQTDNCLPTIPNGQLIEFVNVQCKEHHILKELLETEKLYVTEMGCIISGYKNMMRVDEMKNLVPNEFLEKEDILFCNLDELYDFHARVFSPQLCSCILDVERVATLFQTHQKDFLRMYSFYCQNVIKSDKLREQVGERNQFFLACQSKLGHKLPLAAYMLKPVQRITKYQLLLKDLLNTVDDQKCTLQLKKALEAMLLVLKCVNDRMHQISITGFKGDVSDQGEMLLQAPFNVWVENKKDILKELRIKPMRRHIFLYRKAMLFCKKPSSHRKGEYQFKGLLKTSKIGLTETVKGDPKKFEVWLEGRQEIYIIQAATVVQKEAWVKEIKKVLFEQLTELKGEKLKQYAEKWNYKSLSLEGATPNSGGDSRGNSRPNSHHEVTDDSSSDLSNSEEDDSISECMLMNGKYVALADYCASGHNEVSLKEGDKLELLKVGSAGWWYVKLQNSNGEGWVPASYLESKETRRGIRCSIASSSSQQSSVSQQSTDVCE